jgi:hypothetical protein
LQTARKREGICDEMCSGFYFFTLDKEKGLPAEEFFKEIAYAGLSAEGMHEAFCILLIYSVALFLGDSEDVLEKAFHSWWIC